MRPRSNNRSFPLSLTDKQLALVMTAAQPLNPTQRHGLLLRIESKLKNTRQSMPSTDLLVRCIQSALDEVMA
jgi:hypothetical protein